MIFTWLYSMATTEEDSMMNEREAASTDQLTEPVHVKSLAQGAEGRRRDMGECECSWILWDSPLEKTGNGS